jgi:Zn-dependent peptidase ImmA (M78 family)
MAPPVPIEEIADFNLGLDIIPFPDLRQNWDVDGFLAFACNAIYVDQWQMVNRVRRYRFTIAHELAHLILHSDLYEEAGIGDLEDYLAYQESLDPDLRDACEYQAMNLAGRILLPRPSFTTACRRVLDSVRAKLTQVKDWNTVGELVASRVAPEFEVSDEVASRRLFKDRLWDEMS